MNRKLSTSLAVLFSSISASVPSDSSSVTALDRCKQQIRQFGEEMTVIVECDVHTREPGGLPSISTDCFNSVSDSGVIAGQGANAARSKLRAMGHDQWCSVELKTGLFQAELPAAMSEIGKSGTPSANRPAETESPVPGFSCPNPHPLGELQNATCAAGSQRSTCKAVDEYNRELARLKDRHPELDSARKEFDRSKAIDFGCFKSLSDQASRGANPKDQLRETESAYFKKAGH